ncbi:MAG: hypothetical protein LBE35_01490 [Clostridiales bacterium]|jgi:hypothetical protein|nr:hypothetical protein [Clostridiales bacterium]
MKLSKREIMLLMVLFIIAGGAGYFLLFFQPTMTNIAHLRVENEARRESLELMETLAIARSAQYGNLRAQLEEAEEMWEAYYAAYLPEYFGDTEMLRVLQRIIYPHLSPLSPSLSSSFTAPSRRPDGLYLTTINLSFQTTRSGFFAILDSFEAEDMTTRVVVYSLGAPTAAGFHSVSMVLELLTQEIEEVGEE